MEEKCGWIHPLRQPKIGNMSIFDWVCTFLGAVLISYVCYGKNASLSHILFIFFILVLMGIVIHKITGTPTMLNYYLGLNNLSSVLENRKCK